MEPQLTAATAVSGRSVTCIALVLTAALVACGDRSAQGTSTSITSTSITSTSTSTTQPTSTTAPSCEASVEAASLIDDEEIFIEIEAPQDGQVFQDRLVRFEGTTQPGATVKAGQFEDVSEDGTWCFDLLIGPKPGSLIAVFTAEDETGSQDIDEVEVVYRPRVTTTTSEPSL